MGIKGGAGLEKVSEREERNWKVRWSRDGAGDADTDTTRKTKLEGAKSCKKPSSCITIEQKVTTITVLFKNIYFFQL